VENLTLSTFIVIEPVNEGYALFNWFNGSTHFLTSVQGEIICYLAKNSVALDELRDDFNKVNYLPSEDTTLSFEQFISEAIANEILISH
jgi:hypothetical protein